MNRKLIVVLMVTLLSASLIAGIVLTNNGNESSKTDVPNENAGYIAFFLYDNFQYDITGSVQAQNKDLANGIWTIGRGESKQSCFEDACRAAGIDVSVSGGGINSMNGVADGNFCQMGWINGDWSTEIWLGSNESYKVKFMAIGHGRWSEGNGGDPPVPWQTPDDIKWVLGGETPVSKEGKSAVFYFYDSYVNESASGSGPYSSQVHKFIADGYFVKGCGDTLAEAFRDACQRAFGANAAISYNESNGSITRIGAVSGNLCSLSWNGDAWASCDMSSISYSDGMYVAICHGPLDSGNNPPEPWKKPTDQGIWTL